MSEESDVVEARRIITALRHAARLDRGDAQDAGRSARVRRYVGAACVVVLLLGGCFGMRSGRVAPAEPEDTAFPADFAAVADDAVTPPGVAKKMPAAALKGQAKAPCAPDERPAQHERNGACWYRLEDLPPCGKAYEKDGRCYSPVPETKRPATSVEE